MEEKNETLHPEKRYLYVCEGITDEDKLKKLGCLFVIPTEGVFIRQEITDFLSLCHQVRDIVLILDPDGPGRKIADIVEDRIGKCLRVNVPKKKAIKKGKVGVAQMDIQDLKDYLRPSIEHDLFCDERLSLEDEDFYDLGLIGPGAKEKRMKLVEHYHIPYSSAKKVEECLLMLSVGKETIQEVLDDGTRKNA